MVLDMEKNQTRGNMDGHSISLKVQFLDIEAVNELFIFGATCSRKFDKILHQDKCC